MRELILLRHGESVGNARRILQGHLDFPLTERGQGQARAAARLITAHGWRPSEALSSPLVRCTQTAEILCPALGLENARPQPLFSEIHVGEAGGRTVEDLRASDPALFEPPPSEWSSYERFGGESRADFVARVEEGLRGIADDARVLLVTHGAVLKVAMASLLGLPARFLLDLRNCTCLRLERRGRAYALTHFLHAEEWAERLS